jgi:hypothetical protein
VPGGVPPRTEHRENRYSCAPDDIERVTGVPPRTIEAFVAGRRVFYLG